MESSPSSSSASGSPNTAFWPEARRDEPRHEPFPWRRLVLWLLPGVVAALLLAALGVLLQQQANKRIAYYSPDGQLVWTHADPDGLHVVSGADWHLDDDSRMRLKQSLSVIAGPVWSPRGDALAATVTEDAKTQVALFSSPEGNPTLISSATSDIVTLPAESWSPDGRILALLEGGGDQVLLTLIDIQQQKAITTGLSVDIRSPLAWAPGGQSLLLTTRTEQFTPTLTLVTAGGPIESLPADDGQEARADGAWSPNGRQIAYVVPDQAAGTRGLLAGSIWLTQASTGSAQRLVADGLNFAPVWSPEGNAIVFTRLVTETGNLELYRVDSDGENVTFLGPGSANMAAYPYDRRRSLSWSPDGRRLFFLADTSAGAPEIFVADADGSDAAPILAPCTPDTDSGVRWAPTSRALLIVCTNGTMLLHWVDKEQTPTWIAPGMTPAWEP